MDRKKIVLLVGALAIAVVTAMVARSMFAGAAAPTANAQAMEVMGPKVLVAQRALPAGTIITPDSMAFQAWPKEMVADAYFIEGEADVSKLIGTVVRHPVTAGQPVTQGALVAPGDRGFLAAALQPGMRAITVPVSATSGVAGFIFPGDRVDMVLTQTVEGAEGQPLKASETILRNLRVLATDQATEQQTVEGKTVVTVSGTVTLEVTPRIAEKIAVAETIGELSLSLRSLSDSSSELERALAAGDIVIPDNASPEEEERLLRTAMSRPDDSRSSYVTGGDVSRFQRTTIPPQTAPRAPVMNGAPAAAPAPVRVDVTGPSRPTGPTVNVRRGQETTTVTLSRNSGRSTAGAALAGSTVALVGHQAAGAAQAAKAVPAASSTLR